MTRDDVIRITQAVISDLRIETEQDEWYPNQITIFLKYKDTIISKTWIDVKENNEI